MTKEVLRGSMRAEVRAHCLDLSEGGALLFMPTPLELGAVADFALDLDGETVWVQAEVRHVRPGVRKGIEGHEVGVQFVGIDPHDERRLRDYLARTNRP
jgi:c-di-GMP-binding flagellar brake protein YcgR